MHSVLLGRLLLLIGPAVCSGTPEHSRDACVFTGASGVRHNFSEWAGRAITAVDAMHGTYNVSLCRNLEQPCLDSLTGARMPPGSVYSMFAGEKPGTCWDVLGHRSDLSTSSAAPPGVAVRLTFSHAFDAHLAMFDLHKHKRAQPARAALEHG